MTSLLALRAFAAGNCSIAPLKLIIRNITLLQPHTKENWMRTSFCRTLLASALIGTLCSFNAGAMAQVLPDFVVNEGGIPGTQPNTFTADKLSSNYLQIITFNVDGTYNASAKWQVGQMVSNDGTTPVSSAQLGAASANQYVLYALHQAQGTYQDSGGGRVTLSQTSATLSVHLDPDSNTVFSPPPTGATPWARQSAAEDILIATGSESIAPPSTVDCSAGMGCGNFGNRFTFQLTSAGSAYFTSPVPFYSVAFVSGQFGTGVSPNGTQVISGMLDMAFGGSVTPPPPPTQIPFALFNPSLVVAYTPNGTLFNMNASLALGQNGKAFTPATDVVTLLISGSSVTIPAGSYLPTTGGFSYSGTINGIVVNSTIQLQAGGGYRVLISGSRSTLSNITNPVSLALSIGNNTGAGTVNATIAGKKK
jgi:hypothetical protein